MKVFLRYLKILPVIIYPYMYVPILAVFLHVIDALPDSYYNAAVIGLFVTTVIYNLYSFIIAIVNAVQAARGKMTAREAARMNLITKGVQVPAYILHFIMGFIGMVLSIWGIGLILWSVVISLLTILLTGISSIGCSIRMRTESILSTTATVLMGIGCFIYCADLVIAIVYVVKARKQKNA